MNELIKRPHPAIVHFPLALFPVGFLFLIIYLLRQDTFWLSASFWCTIVGVVTTLPVALTGVLDMKRLHHTSWPGHRLLNAHFLNGIIITALSVIGGLFFFFRSPIDDPDRVPYFGFWIAILTLDVLMQGYLGAQMVYQQHLGIDGDTR